MSLSDWVKAARRHGEMRTQQALGEALGVSKQNVNAWEKNRHEPSYSQLVRIAQLTGYPLPAEAREAGNVVPPKSSTEASSPSPRALQVAALFDRLSPRDMLAVEALAINLQPEEATASAESPSAAPIATQAQAE